MREDTDADATLVDTGEDVRATERSLESRWDVLQKVISRLGYGLLTYFPVMICAAAFLSYFELMPPNDDNNEQTALAFLGLPVWMLVVALGGSVALKIGLSLLPLAFGGWGIASSYERLQEIRKMPDLNNDGLFTISDIPSAIFSIFVEVGRKYSHILVDTKVGVFLEITTNPYSTFWSIALTFIVYFMMAQGLHIIWTYQPDNDQKPD